MTAPATDPTLDPFLPGTNIQFAWDSTCLGMLKTCPRMYQYTMIEGWEPKNTSIHLKFGLWYHEALDTYDKQRAAGASFKVAARATIRQLLERIREWDVDRTCKPGDYKNKYSLLQLVVDYLDNFRDDPATTYILENGQPAVELSFRFELEYGPEAEVEVKDPDGYVSYHQQPYMLCGHLDRIVEYGDVLFCLDHKTTTTTPGNYFFDKFSPDNQMSLYTIATRVVYKALVRGVIIEAAQIRLTEPNRFERGTTLRTKDQMHEWMKELRVWLDAAESYALANYWPMNDTSCDKYGGCRFRGVCSKSPSVREFWLAEEFDKKPLEERWNPLKPR
jgi:hypothetical protein